jgi:hypothetical protein
MSDGRVYRTELGWVAADDAGWTDEVYATENEARAVVGLPPIDRDDDGQT